MKKTKTTKSSNANETSDSSLDQSIETAAIEQGCITPPAPAWVDCDECLKWFVPVYITKQLTYFEGKEIPITVNMQFEILYEYDLCFRGRQQGKLLFTTSIIPQEEIRI